MRHLLTLVDLTTEEIRGLLQLARQLRLEWKQRGNQPLLSGQMLAMLFEKPSLRTRVAFEMAMYHLGGRAMYLSAWEIGLGKREAVKDVAQVLSRYTQGIMARVFNHSDLEILATHAGVPVINGLSDYDHPCQVMADLLTLQDRFGNDLRGRHLVFIGDGYNMAHGLLFGASKMGLNITIATPQAYKPMREVMGKTMEFAEESGAKVRWTTDPQDAVRDADVVYTDVWTSMGQEAENEIRRQAFKDYQLNGALLQRAPAQALIMHCLPAHRGEEVSDEVIDSTNSIVFDQAENRLHAQKAILAWLMGGAKIS